MAQLAVAYLRTSSATNADGDSEARQRAAVMAYARATRTKIGAEFRDMAVSGADPLDQRRGFTDMLAWCRENDVRTIVVENASRFARDIIVQETGHRLLADAGFRLISADSPNAFLDDTPTATLIRQILGVVSEFEKANLVAKLRGARDRKSIEAGRRIEGRPGYSESNPEMVREARRLARKSPKTGKGLSLLAVSAELARLGHVTKNEKPFSASQVKRLLGK